MISRIGGAVVDDDFMYPSEFSEILRFPEHLLIRQSRRKSDDENEIPLDDTNVGQVLPVLGDLLLLGLEEEGKNWLLILNTDQPLKFLKPNLHYQLQ